MSFEETVQLYTERDKNKDIKECIQWFLNKIHRIIEVDMSEYLVYLYRQTDVRLKSYNEWKEEYILTDKYKQFVDYLEYVKQRHEELSKLKDVSDIKEFYQACTMEELDYVGY